LGFNCPQDVWNPGTPSRAALLRSLATTLHVAEIFNSSEPEEYEDSEYYDVDDFAEPEPEPEPEPEDFSADDYPDDACIDLSRRETQRYLFPNYTKAHVLQTGTGEGFSVSERLRLVKVGEAVARARGGWLTDRHKNFPTTDLSVRDSFPELYADKINALVERWILPRLAELGSLRAADLYIEDLFIVKYECDLDGSTRETPRAAQRRLGVERLRWDSTDPSECE